MVSEVAALTILATSVGFSDLTVIIVSYNTRELTVRAIETLVETTAETKMKVVVFDNASTDGSADAVAQAFPHERFPMLEIIRSKENLGFAAANNVVAEQARTEWLLLLNPDTECHTGAVDNLMAFAREHPEAGIFGGRTVFPDGSLNAASCWNRITLWSLFCRSTGLSIAFPKSGIFNSEAIGEWKRDTVRHVDIVVGCFLLIPRSLWNRLDGFNLKYFMYGEEADLCLRAARMGYRPMITPEAEIMHIVGAATKNRAEKQIKVAKARATLVRDHWPAWKVPFGIGLMWAASGIRYIAATFLAGFGEKWKARSNAQSLIWKKRKDWLSGY